MPLVINLAKKYSILPPKREYTPKNHEIKQGTPNLGGLVIIFSIILSSTIFCNIWDHSCFTVLFSLLSFGLVGFIDDTKKIFFPTFVSGISAKQKIIMQIVIASILCYLIMTQNDEKYGFLIPFSTNYFHFSSHNSFYILGISINLIKLIYYIFSVFIIVGTSNAVNLTDGLDGLAIPPFCITIASLTILSTCLPLYSKIYFIKNHLPYLTFIIIGSCLGFLIYNLHPAKIFMGDTGSLALGGMLGTLSIVLNQQFSLGIIGGIFVLESLSVIIQVFYFKISKGKRFFKMAPLHHHFEKMGNSETAIVKKFFIISLIFAFIGLFPLITYFI